VSSEGFAALYKGLLSSIILLINPIISYVLYEFLKLRIQSKPLPIIDNSIFKHKKHRIQNKK
jgi:hypothetical protein